MRGQFKLFQDIFEHIPEGDRQRRGRSAHLHKKRNECLIDRYYYYGHFVRYKYQIILEELQNEFFISIYTIPDLLESNYSYLTELQSQKPGKDFFEEKWPHLVW